MKKTLLLIFFLACITCSFAQRSAVAFSKANYDYADTNDPSFNKTSFTVEAWVRPKTLTTNTYQNCIVGNETTNNKGFVLRMSSNTLDFTYGYGTGWQGVTYTNPSNFSLITWYHLAVVYTTNADGKANIKLYVNGTMTASNTIDASRPIKFGSQNLWIGNTIFSSQSDKRNFDGAISELKIWDHARTGVQIAADMAAITPEDASGLYAYYKLTETNGTTIYNSKTGGTNGTFKNTSMAFTLATPNVNIPVVYVNAANTQAANTDGTTWTKAYSDLGAAIALAAKKTPSQVWVAAGTYQPSTTSSFRLTDNIKIYGGFAATGTPTFAGRNWASNTTTLKGNGAGVVFCANLTQAAVLDGFTITGGERGFEESEVGGINNLNSSTTLSNLIISGNTGHFAGGIFNTNSSPIITNVLIKGNSGGTAGGMLNNNSSPILTNVTISGNTSSNYSGMFNENNSSPSIRNSIIWGNGTTNVANTNSTPTYQNSIAQGVTATGVNNTDPLFKDATNGDYTLKTGSPAIGTGDASLYAPLNTITSTPMAKNASNGNATTLLITSTIPDLSAITTDLAGNPRFSSGKIDMGAYQYQAPVIRYVKSNGTGNGSSWATASADLQTIIDASKADDEVWVAAGTYQPTNNSFAMKEGVKIYGGFAATGTPTFTDRNWASNITILKGGGAVVIKSSNLTKATLLDGFTITGGMYNMISQAGGIQNTSSSPTLSNLIISDNTGDFSGGIYNNNSSPIITNVLIKSNTGLYFAGGMYNGNNSSPILTNVTISGNTGAASDGMYNDNSFPKIRNSIIWGNGVNNMVVSNGSAATYLNSIAQGVTATGVSNTDPLFKDATNGDYTLKTGSPAIGTGDASLYATDQTPDLATITKDLVGNPRFSSGKIDMGVYQSIITLPVKLISYIATAKNNGALLTWATAQELNNKGFEIYRAESPKTKDQSEDNAMFVKIGEVSALATHNTQLVTYNFTDKTPLNGNNYYKLVQVDNDGKTTELGIRTLNFGLPTSDIRLFPNPFIEYFNISSSQTAEASISNLAGQIIKRITLQKGETRIDATQWPVGIYLLHTSDKTMKLVKN